ncbi:MAG: ABC transporter permease [Bacteroidetes bacterium]|nr:ABC transporter permease [Bacteroidota bacterium]MCB0842952.1 ABC transporter permease [Bacteroidota bacterium]
MLRNYIKIAWRNLRKDKLITAINILGLSIGLACCILIFVFAKHEWSYDTFHKDAENIFRISAKFKSFYLSSTPAPLGQALEDDFPSVTQALRLDERDIILNVNGTYFKEKTLFADPNFFDFFTFPLRAGNPDHVLAQSENLVITQEFADKYFPGESPIGKMVRINLDSAFTEFQISGVAENIPSNSSMRFNMIMPLINAYRGREDDMLNSWMSYSTNTFIRLGNVSQLEDLEKSLPEFILKYMGKEISTNDNEDETDYAFLFSSLVDFHLSDRGFGAGMEEATNVFYLYALILIGILVLVIACFNFMNLTNAKASGRLKEIGIRKVIGAQRKNLIWQFWMEAIFLSFISIIFAMVLADLFLPFLNQITGYELKLELWRDPVIIPSLIVLALITGILAGSYPAFVLSGIDTLDTFKSNFKIGGNNWLTRLSLIFQFGLSIALIVGAILMKQQQDFVQQVNLGFSEEQVLVVPLQTMRGEQAAGARLARQFKQKLASESAIVSVSGTSTSFTRGNNVSLIETDEGDTKYVYEFNVDPEYIDLLEIELLAGENFKNDLASKGLIVNESFLKSFEIENPIGHIVDRPFAGIEAPEIIGVVKDYHYQNLRSNIYPMILYQQPTRGIGYLMVKMKGGEIDQAIASVRSAWEEIRPQKPFEYHFLDEDMGKEYEREKRWSKAITIGSILSIFIACIGLFGLTALAATRRTKEIGIRKVLGASYKHIIILLSRQFFWLILISNVIAWPVAYWAMNKWLENFAYKIDVKPWAFLFGAMMVIVIALLTTGYQTFKAARSNPVEALRDL